MSTGRFCPNRVRTKRPHRGGGTPGCQGRLEVVFLVGIAVPFKRWSRGAWQRFEDSVSAVVAKRGVRVTPDMLNSAKYDVRCNACGYSLERAKSAFKARKRRAA